MQLHRVRPFSEVELEARCRVVTNRAPGEPQIILGQNKNFTFDQVYFMESEQDQIFHGAVQQLIDG
jgi:kinesin family protein 4/21/27